MPPPRFNTDEQCSLLKASRATPSLHTVRHLTFLLYFSSYRCVLSSHLAGFTRSTCLLCAYSTRQSSYLSQSMSVSAFGSIVRLLHMGHSNERGRLSAHHFIPHLWRIEI